MGIFKKAKSDFVAAARLDPSNRSIRKLIDKAKKAMARDARMNKRLAKAVAQHLSKTLSQDGVSLA